MDFSARYGARAPPRLDTGVYSSMVAPRIDFITEDHLILLTEVQGVDRSCLWRDWTPQRDLP